MDGLKRVLVVLIVLLVLALAIEVERDARGVWEARGPGFEVVWLPDPAGPGVWVYVAGRLWVHWRWRWPAQAPPATRPTATPSPVPTTKPWPAPLESV